MNLFELFVKIGADTSQAEKGMKNTQKNSETLTNKIKAMSAQFEAAQKNVDKLTKEFNESVSKVGATDKATQELANKLSAAEKEAGKFAKELDEVQKEAERSEKALDDCNEEIEDTGEKAEKSGKGLSNFASKLGKGLATAAKIGTAAVGVASAAIVALTTQAVNNFAEYEQLAGGAQKIFDQMDYSKIAADANNAYKELGLSARQYIAVINDVGATFAATMGDEAGYEAAKTGLKAISDYASGTGKNVDELSQKFTLITRSTSSYQSIADQFSGILPATSKDFLKQAQAAGLLSKKYKELTKVPVAEYQAAVSQMLQRGVSDLGLANNTANEAMTTISGSIGMLKSSWDNLITGLADDDADLDMLINNFVESAGAAAQQIIPKISTAFGGIAKLIRDIIPVAVEEIPKIINENIVVINDAAISIVEGIITGINDSGDELFSKVFQTIVDVLGSIFKMAPVIVKLAKTIVRTLAIGLSKSLPDLLPSLFSAVTEILGVLSDSEFLDTVVGAALTIIQTLAYAIGDFLPEIIKSAGLLIEAILTTLLKPENLEMLVSTAAQLIMAIIVGILSALPELIRHIVRLLEEIADQFEYADWPGLGKKLIDEIWAGIKNVWGDLKKWWSGIIEELYEEAKKQIVLLRPLFKLWDEIYPQFKYVIEKVTGVGKDLVDGFKEGIKSKWKDLKTWFKSLFGDLIEIATSTLVIGSPSKLFKKFGRWTAEGFGIGFEDEFDGVKNEMKNAMTFDDMAVNIGGSIRRVGSASASHGGYASSGTQDVNVTVTIDENVNAMGLARELLPYLKIAAQEAYA